MLDGVFCRALGAELNGALAGARVDKIHQTGAKELIFELFGGDRKILLVSALPSAPRICFVDSYDRPPNPTMLCMLLRKHLTGARITAAAALEDERIIKISFSGTDELGHPVTRALYTELMGKYSNVILCGGDDRILGAFSMSDVTDRRCIMTGAKYLPPDKQDKLSPFNVSEDVFLRLASEHSDMASDSFLLQSFLGFSPVTSREIAFRACGQTDAAVAEAGARRLWECFSDAVDSVRGGRVSPCISAGGKAFSYMELTQYGEGSCHPDTLCDLLRDYYSEKALFSELRRLSADINRVVSGNRTRIEKKLSARLAELDDCSKKDTFRRRGDLITANLYRIPNGASAASVFDYETGEETVIPLDSRLSPARNAQRMYAKYSKLKRAEEHLHTLIASDRAELDYVMSVEDALSRARTRRELDEIRTELSEVGYLSSGHAKPSGSKKPAKKLPAGAPLVFRTTDGLKVTVGRNNRQNDYITQSAEKTDIWFHVRKSPGSHVVLSTGGKEPTDRDYTESAMLAAFYSSVRGAQNAEVDYTYIRFVKKPSGSKPGFVTYDKYYTAVVNAEMPEVLCEK